MKRAIVTILAVMSVAGLSTASFAASSGIQCSNGKEVDANETVTSTQNDASKDSDVDAKDQFETPAPSDSGN